MKMKRIALLMACLMLATLLLTACSAGDPTGSWVLTNVKNDDTQEWGELLSEISAAGGAITANITSSNVTIEMEYYGYVEEMMSFSYYQRGDRMIDPSDDTEVTFKLSGDTLTLYFADCDLVFTKAD